MSGADRRAVSAPAFGALRHPSYRAFFVTSALAMMGDNIEHVISYWVLFERFHSPALAGVAILTHWLPFLLFSVYAGHLADRFDRRRLIQLGAALFMAVSAAWAVLILTDTLQVWHAVVLLIIHGIAGVLWSPASQLLVHDIVGTPQLQSGVRLNATARNLGLLLGPAIGGTLMLIMPPPYGLLVNVLSYAPLVAWLQWRAPRARRRVADAGAALSMRRLLGVVAADRTIVLMLTLAGAASFFIGNAIQAQMPEFAHELGAGSADVSYSLLLGANAAGAFAGGLILESRGLLAASARTAIVLAIAWCAAMALFAAASNLPLALAAMSVAGFLNLAFNAMAQTLVQLRAPAPLRGRLIGLHSMLANGMRAFSGVTIGLVGELIGVHRSLAVSAIVLMVLLSALLPFVGAPRRPHPAGALEERPSGGRD